MLCMLQHGKIEKLILTEKQGLSSCRIVKYKKKYY